MATTRKEASFNSPGLGAKVPASSPVARQRKAKQGPRRAKLLEEIMARSTNAIAALDLEGRFTLANHRVAEITGYAQEELLGRSYTVLLAPKSLDPVQTAITRTLTEGNLISGFETEVVRKDGTIRNVAFNLSPVFVEGKIVGGNLSARLHANKLACLGFYRLKVFSVPLCLRGEVLVCERSWQTTSKPPRPFVAVAPRKHPAEGPW